MNDKLNSDTYHYRLNQLHRDEVMRAADQERLARLAAGEPKERGYLLVGLIRRARQFFTRHPLSIGGSHKNWRVLRHPPSAMLIAILLSGALLASVFPSHAQDLYDPGQRIQHPERIYYGVGLYFYERENYERAIDQFTRAIEWVPQMGDAYAARADSFAALQQYDLALVDYTQALELNGDNPLTLLKRAFTFAALDDLDAAQRDFEHLISVGSEYPS
jgi:tetratricopeptide (TPR) repeat protein